MSKKLEKRVDIIKQPINTSKELINGLRRGERHLINCACEYGKILRKDNVEVFERMDNILATEQGYFIALDEQEVREFEGGIDNPKPHKGKDGRMKIMVTEKGGEKKELDLANTVAEAYLPKKKRFKLALFKDNNFQNCMADNLRWAKWYEYLAYKIKNVIRGTL